MSQRRPPTPPAGDDSASDNGASDGAPPTPPPRTSAPGHWTTDTSRHARPPTPEFGPDIEYEADILMKILVDAGKGMLLLPSNGWDEVAPGIAIGEADSALDLELLASNGFTHVYNTCEMPGGGPADFYHVESGPDHYGDQVAYGGAAMDDQSGYDISQHFEHAIAFISRVVKPCDRYQKGQHPPQAPVMQRMQRKVMVHCKAGASRSATVVIAYLVSVGVPLREAVRYLRAGREIAPNSGFLKRLAVYSAEVEAAAAAAAAAATTTASGCG